jgi:hypothetical protein
VPQQMIWFFTSIAFSLIAWGTVTSRYIWPDLRLRPRAEALRPLLVLHGFRFIGLAFLKRPMATSLLRCSPWLRFSCCPVPLA